MLWIDYAIIAVVVVSGLVSLLRGFVREAVALATWIIAIWVAVRFAGDFAPLFSARIESTTVRLLLAGFGLFAGTLIAGALLNYLVALLVDSTGLTGTDRIIGLMFGLVRGVVLVAAVVVLAGLTTLPDESWWGESLLIPQLEGLGQSMVELLPPEVAEQLEPPPARFTEIG